jgi:magnesium transporter
MNAPKADQEKQLNLEQVTWGDLTWVNIVNPTTRETEYLAENYSFHPLDLDDCLSRQQRPKIDEYKEYLFVVFHFPVFNKEVRITRPSQLSVFIGDNYLITLHKGELKPLVKLFKECQLEEESRSEYLGRGAVFLLYRIVDRLVDSSFPILAKVFDNIESVEDEIFADGRSGMVKEISILRRDVISFRRIVWPMRAVIGSLQNKLRRFVKDDEVKQDLEVYFGDMTDHVDKIWDTLDESKEIIEGLNDTYDSLASNRTNEVMRMLTIIGTVLLPLIVVASIYGMNIDLPFKSFHYAWLLLLLVTLVIVGGMLLFFRRQHWI